MCFGRKRGSWLNSVWILGLIEMIVERIRKVWNELWRCGCGGDGYRGNKYVWKVRECLVRGF